MYFGSDTTVGEGCQINKSIIGNHCVINAGAKLEYCVVLDGCVLSPNSHYQYCLIEKVNEVLKIHTFRNDILDEYQVLIEKDIFPVTPPSEQNTL